MSKVTVWASKKTGVPEEKLNFFGALLLAFLPAKTQRAIREANQDARALEAVIDGHVKLQTPGVQREAE